MSLQNSLSYISETSYQYFKASALLVNFIMYLQEISGGKWLEVNG